VISIGVIIHYMYVQCYCYYYCCCYYYILYIIIIWHVC